MQMPEAPKAKFKSEKALDQKHCVMVAERFRRQSLVSAADLSRETGISQPMMCLLENGARKWKPEVFEKYINGIVAIRGK